MAQSNPAPDTHIETHFGFAAACPRCGGWTTFGGMSQYAECTSPKVCEERQDKLTEGDRCWQDLLQATAPSSRAIS